MTLQRVRNRAVRVADLFVRARYFPRAIPPPHLRRSRALDVGGYVRGGDFQLRLCRRWTGLHEDSDLLDVGCGDGRFAAALAGFLRSGSYQGFDVDARFVSHLSRTLGRRRARFGFQHSDLWHSYYNPTGMQRIGEFVFPYAEASFDIVYLNSIFSHFLPADVAHYLREIRRVLKPGGIVYSTYYLGNPESVAADQAGHAAADLRLGRPRLLNFREEHCWTRDEDVKERIVVIDEEWLRAKHAAAGLGIEEIVWGTWCGRPDTGENHQQDIVLARKPSEAAA